MHHSVSQTHLIPKDLKKKLRDAFVEEAKNKTPHVSKTPTTNPGKEKKKQSKTQGTVSKTEYLKIS